MTTRRVFLTGVCAAASWAADRAAEQLSAPIAPQRRRGWKTWLDPLTAKFRREPIKVAGRPNTVEDRGRRQSFATEGRKNSDFLAVLTVHAASEPGPAVSLKQGVISVSTAAGCVRASRPDTTS